MVFFVPCKCFPFAQNSVSLSSLSVTQEEPLKSGCQHRHRGLAGPVRLGCLGALLLPGVSAAAWVSRLQSWHGPGWAWGPPTCWGQSSRAHSPPRGWSCVSLTKGQSGGLCPQPSHCQARRTALCEFMWNLPARAAWENRQWHSLYHCRAGDQKCWHFSDYIKDLQSPWGIPYIT